MKTNKRAVFFLFLCMMGALMLTITSSQSLLPNDRIVYAEEDEDDEVEENAPAPVTNSNGRYETLQIPSILSTAYADGLRGAQMAEDDGETADQFKKNMDTILGDRPVTLDDETGEVVSTGTYRFDALGLFMGPMSGSSGSGTQDVRETLSMSLDELQNVYNYDDSGEAYWAFGRAVQNLRVDAEKADTSTISATAGVDTLAGVSRQVSNMGVQLLKSWSPAPVVLSFTDASLLYSSRYEGNRLIGIINGIEPLERVIQIVGQPVPGMEAISYSQLVVIVLIILGLSGSVLTIFMGNRFFPVSIRKTLVKVLVMIVAVPLAMHVYDWGLDALDDIANADAYSTEYQHARSHLLLGLWAEYGFAAPSGVTLNVRDGRFILTRDDIRAINGMVLGLDGSDENEDEIIADAILDQIDSDDNETHISWQNKMLPVQNRPWQTDALIQLAEAIGSNQDIESSDTVMENWRLRTNYIYGGNLRAYKSGSETGAFNYRQDGGRKYSEAGGGAKLKYGLSPIASYNLLNTQFSTNALTVKSNLSTGSTLPSVAPTAYAYAVNSVMGSTESDEELPTLVRWLLEFVLLFASIKALAKIITSGFGGMIHGGARSMFGSSAGWGELLGAVFAVIFGVMGLSFFSLITLKAAESLYGVIHEVTDGMIDSSTVLSAGVKSLSRSLSPTGFISWIPFVSDPISGWIEGGIISLLSGLLAMFFLPKFVRIPIEAFAGWVSTLPTAWADKAQHIENRFTGDSLRGGASSGALAGAMQKAGESMVKSGTAVAAGGGMIAGAGVKAGGGAIKNTAGKIRDKMKDKKKGGKDDGDGENESIAAAAVGAETDEKGNPIAENITDNEGGTEEGGTEDTTADETNETGDVNTEEEESIADGIESIGGGYGVDADGNLVNGDGEAITDSDGNNIQPKLNNDGQLDSASANADGHMLNDSGEVALDADGNPIPIFQPGGGNENDNPTGEGDATNGDITEGSINEGELSQDISANDENTQGDVNADESSSDTDSSTNTSTATDDTSSNQSSLNVGGTSSESIDSNDTSSGDTVSGGEVSTNDTSSGDSIASSGGEVSTNDTSSGDSIASSGGEVSTNDTSSGDTVSGGEVNTNDTSSGDSIASSGGEVNTNDTSSGDSIASSSGDVSTNDTSSGDTVSGGEVNTSDEISGGSIASSGDDVNTSQDTSGGDVNSSQVSTGSEDGGTTETTESGVHSDSHSESTMGGQTSESGQGSGASVSNDSTIEGSQVTQDTSQNNTNVTTDSNAQVNASSEERNTNQGDSADNSQRADVKSNTETVNDNQSSNTSIGGSQGSPTKPSTQGGQSSTKPTSQGGSPTSQGGSKVTSKPSTGGGQSAEKPSSSGSQTGKKQQPNSGPNTTPSGGAKVSETGGTKSTSSSNNRRPNISSIVGGRNAGGQTIRPSATVGKDGSIASNNPPQSAGQGAQNTQKQSGKENTSQKASRISDKIGRGSAPQGGVSNAQQAAMGAVHMLGGLTGMENVTQQGVNNLRSKQGKGVNSKETSKTPNQSQNTAQNNSDHDQQIIDIERRKEEEQGKRVKKPSFIKKVRNKGKNNKR